MSASNKKRLIIVALGTFATCVIYMGVYFACVSIEFTYPMEVGGLGVGSARVYYNVGPLSQDMAHSFFEPARLCDAYYLRPKRWADKPHD